MKYYIIAGEASGDLHGSNLMKEIRKLDPEADFRVWGGDLMKAEDAYEVVHIRNLAFMGFWEVVNNLSTISKLLAFCKKDIEAFRPHGVILIDYPGFNLRMAQFLKRRGFPVIYYISPQVWAWKSSRVKTIRRVVDRMLVILPFEKAFYARYDFPVDFIGHPLADAIDQFKNELHVSQSGEKPVLALLPGSRKQEIEKMLPVMLQAAKEFTDYKIVVAGAPAIDHQYYNDFMKGYQAEIWHGKTYELLNRASLAAVTSGTATLETALFKVPQVVCYKGNRVSYLVARTLVKIPFISLVNLVMEEEVVKELIQNDFTAATLAGELRKIALGESRNSMLEKYEVLREKLGKSGASARAAGIITNMLSRTRSVY
jgi:lipid-A-disaccharide synthase